MIIPVRVINTDPGTDPKTSPNGILERLLDLIQTGSPNGSLNAFTTDTEWIQNEYRKGHMDVSETGSVLDPELSLKRRPNLLRKRTKTVPEWIHGGPRWILESSANGSLKVHAMVPKRAPQ